MFLLKSLALDYLIQLQKLLLSNVPFQNRANNLKLFRVVSFKLLNNYYPLKSNLKLRISRLGECFKIKLYKFIKEQIF